MTGAGRIVCTNVIPLRGHRIIGSDAAELKGTMPPMSALLPSDGGARDGIQGSVVWPSHLTEAVLPVPAGWTLGPFKPAADFPGSANPQNRQTSAIPGSMATRAPVRGVASLVVNCERSAPIYLSGNLTHRSPFMPPISAPHSEQYA